MQKSPLYFFHLFAVRTRRVEVTHFSICYDRCSL